MINFSHPEFLLGLLIIPILAYFYIWVIKKKKKAAIKFSNLHLMKKLGLKKVNKDKWIFLFTLLTLISLIISLSDPQIPLERTKEGVNVVLALDTSGSMQAQDFKPSRLGAAKESAKLLIDSLKGKDNIGIVIFSNGATTASYLTPDKDKAIKKLEGINSAKGETAIGDGLSLAIDMATSIPNKKKVVILLSDGENNAGVISVEEAIKFAKENNIQVYTIGIGSEKPVVIGYDWFGKPQYARLDEKTLKKIAKETNGEYFKAVNEYTLEKIYKKIPKKIKREKELTSVKDFFITLGIIFMLLGIYLRYGRYRILQ
jgi:Ca-activated chloride channel family protein